MENATWTEPRRHCPSPRPSTRALSDAGRDWDVVARAGLHHDAAIGRSSYRHVKPDRARNVRVGMFV
eukprot:12026117-Alexandrium_andersonii.AAC.1